MTTASWKELAFAGLGQRKHKCPNRLRELMGLIDGREVFAFSSLELTYRNRSLCNVYGIVQSKNLQPGATSMGLDL
jgi:hypothetical protein